MRRLLWRRHFDDQSFEYCEVRKGVGGIEIAGRIIAAHEGQPVWASYQLECSFDLATPQRIRVERLLGNDAASLDLQAMDGKRWRLNGAPAPALDGCSDFDLEWSPVTNVFPIRRLNAVPGAQEQVSAIWLRMPALTVEVSNQRYTCLDATRYLYESLESGFSATLDIDDLGLPISYGRIWMRIADWAECT